MIIIMESIKRKIVDEFIFIIAEMVHNKTSTIKILVNALHILFIIAVHAVTNFLNVHNIQTT